jgi:preprotein translocase subunit SecD
MNTLNEMLQNADPLRREAPPTETQRDASRRIVARTTLEQRHRTRGPRSVGRRTALSAVAIMAATVVGYVVVSKQVLAAVRFEARLAEDRPAPGLIVAHVGNSTRLIYLHPEAVVTNDDIAQSSVVESGHSYGISVELLPPGADRMRQATASHVGRPVAILLDGSVVMAPTVRSPIDGSAMITGDFTRADAERIAAGITR